MQSIELVKELRELRKSLLLRQCAAFIECLRPRQWSKNGLVFAALLFSIAQVSLVQWLDAAMAFLLFCLVSGGVYVINDYIDREKDRLHPDKAKRPIASGRLHPRAGLGGGILILLIAIGLSFYKDTAFGGIVLLYFMSSLAYSVWLKHLIIIDVMTIAGGFVLRAVAGGIVIDRLVTAWFALCTLLLALFLAIGKRRQEVFLLADSRGGHRQVLQDYSIEFLDQLNGIVTTAVIMSYALYTISGGKPVELMGTVPFVIYGMFRYLYLVHSRNQGGAPEKVLFEDRPLLAAVLLWAVSVAGIQYIWG
ncbi:Hypothetical protein LUCI_4584 [Lucifera butyrica]|uniref:Decaprenyl-phosphate phosphoribosyltransferase n=1 Tax=Lucifera butyrica TaxID=1351585 RepID=A0A498RCM5_9FIRM|nr:decaprenyl-phosphate phosphoribosyltransferase [Lucifera butyrica]VBB09294.1 Hypothetical protein LUCI_4584 [Lucifera butyrica]